MKRATETMGLPAVLEHCAEECAELTHACLKMARKIRNENPTPKSYEEIKEELTGEIADVEIQISEIVDGLCIDLEVLNDLIREKCDRRTKRIEEHKKQEE